MDCRVNAPLRPVSLCSYEFSSTNHTDKKRYFGTMTKIVKTLRSPENPWKVENCQTPKLGVDIVSQSYRKIRSTLLQFFFYILFQILWASIPGVAEWIFRKAEKFTVRPAVRSFRVRLCRIGNLRRLIDSDEPESEKEALRLHRG